MNDSAIAGIETHRTPAYDNLRELVAGELDRERSRSHQFLLWLVIGESALVGLYGLSLQQLASLSAQEPATYPKENIPVSSLAWFTAWALPMLGLGLAVLVFWLVAGSLVRAQGAVRHWRQHEGHAASAGQALPAAVYPTLRAGGWSLLLVPVLFVTLWFAVIRAQSLAIESGIENWRAIPQDQA